MLISLAVDTLLVSDVVERCRSGVGGVPLMRLSRRSIAEAGGTTPGAAGAATVGAVGSLPGAKPALGGGLTDFCFLVFDTLGWLGAGGGAAAATGAAGGSG